MTVLMFGFVLLVHAKAADVKLYDSGNQAAEWVKAHPDRPEAKLIQEKIASVPQAIWLVGSSLDGFVKDVKTAKAKGGTILFVVYNIPGRDNGNYSAGGLNNPAAYTTWLKQVALVLGSVQAIAIVEPDALGLGQGLSEGKRLERYGILANAVKILKQDENCKVYLDVSQWVGPEAAANGLNQSGIEDSDGFCLNTSAFEKTDSCIAFGTKVSALVGGKHFIVDTSRNGNGPWSAAQKDNPWCNPPGRALGSLPTFDTGNPLCDAYLWIKRPGESDGSCRGGPAAGTFWPEYAYDLAKNAK